MSPWEFNKLLRNIKTVPDHFLVRLVRAASEEILKRAHKDLKDLYNKRRNH